MVIEMIRYMPLGKNIFSKGYSSFRGGMSFGDKKLAKKFISEKRKEGTYKRFKIVELDMHPEYIERSGHKGWGNRIFR